MSAILIEVDSCSGQIIYKIQFERCFLNKFLGYSGDCLGMYVLTLSANKLCLKRRESYFFCALKVSEEILINGQQKDQETLLLFRNLGIITILRIQKRISCIYSM